jgi:HPt (histidine-containing phosphotransfer) domain-containing protein
MPVDRRPIDQMVEDVGPEAFQRLARLFAEETQAAATELRRQLEAENWRELGRQAHSLKHATSSFGLTQLATRAAALEKAADAQRGVEAAIELTALEAETGTDLAALDRLLQEMWA